MNSTAALYRLLGDDVRLRILRVLAAERLNVTELTAVLGIAQSGVSRHLGLLKDAGLVAEAREGGFSYYRLATEAGDGGDRAALWSLLREQFVSANGSTRADDARLKEVLRHRKENFETHGGDRRQMVPGRSWAAWSRALGELLPSVTVADLGCGDGYFTLEAAQWARRVVAVDRSEEVLERGRALARRRRVSNITWKQGEIESVPLATESVDVALLSQALHHADEPLQAVREATRILAPGGKLLVLDLRAHQEEWVRDRFGNRWLGFDENVLRQLMADAGLTDVRVSTGARLKGDPFVVLVASGVKSSTVRRRRSTPPRRAQS